jgi:hypothetical protein
MHHLTKSLSRVALFAVLSVLLAVCLNGFISDRISSFERTQVSRSRMQTQIHDTLEKRYDARILDTRLLGRCGITAYIVTLRDTAGGESTLYFDIDTGVPVRHDLLNGCPPRLTGSATGDGSDTGVRVGRYAAVLPEIFGGWARVAGLRSA